jgi:hypothetical protein
LTRAQPHSPVRRGVAALVGLGVVCPLLTLLVLQYWSLTRLEAAVPAAARNDLSDKLDAVANDVQAGFAADLGTRLDVASDAIPLPMDSDFGASELFRDARPDYVKLYGVIGFTPDSKIGLSMFDPKSREVFTNLRSPEGRAIIATFWRSVSRYAEREHFDPGTLAVTEDDPRGRVVMRIVPRPEPYGIAATCVILDEADYRGVYLPHAVEAAFARHFTEAERETLSVVIRDRDGKTVYATRDEADGRDEVVEPLPWAFADWTVAVRSNGTSYIQ